VIVSGDENDHRHLRRAICDSTSKPPVPASARREDQVRRKLLDGPNRFTSIAALAHDFKSDSRGEQLANAFPPQFLVVNDERATFIERDSVSVPRRLKWNANLGHGSRSAPFRSSNRCAFP
jgi:hypothetical protein